MNSRAVESWLPFEIACATDVGCVREANEDSYSVVEPHDTRMLTERGRLLLVADGMGGAVGGERASAIVTHLVPETYYKRSEGLSVGEALRGAIEAANHEVYTSAARDPELRGMGSTCTAAVVRDDALWFGHVGDSRLYLVRDRQIEQLTTDHSKVAQLVADRVIDAAEAAVHPERSVLLRSIGPRAMVEVDVIERPRLLHRGDRLLLCSDGLSGFVDDREILEIVLGEDIHAAVDRLIDLAKARGGDDNITVQIAQLGRRELPPTLVGTDVPTTEPSREPETRIEAPPVDEARPRLRGAAVLALAVLVLVGAVLVWWFIGRPQRTERSDAPSSAPQTAPSSIPVAATAPDGVIPFDPDDAGITDASVEVDAGPFAPLDKKQFDDARAELGAQQSRCPDLRDRLVDAIEDRLGKLDLLGSFEDRDAALIRGIARVQQHANRGTGQPMPVDGQPGPKTQSYLFGEVICP